MFSRCCPFFTAIIAMSYRPATKTATLIETLRHGPDFHLWELPSDYSDDFPESAIMSSTKSFKG
jgi:hypothetical protein